MSLPLPMPRILCEGYTRFVASSLHCHCAFHPQHTSCLRVIQQGEPGGKVRWGRCATCQELQCREWAKKQRALVQHMKLCRLPEQSGDPFREGAGPAVLSGGTATGPASPPVSERGK